MVEQIDKNSVIASELLENIESINLEDSDNLEKCENHNNNVKTEDSPQSVKEEEPSNFQNDDTNQANCFALTVRKDYNLTIIKNIFTTSVRMSLKIAFSTFVLNFLRMFF